ncbi:BRICHOS domain-containing protein 5 isoform X1 [Protopterus annectens]|uniref:BRICHOS domain-containing protein 5 isoform X1 n=1 Tax=Protopterus annectens TaxID=7888 RepID=UPI001CFB0E1F|nr:BRICHOS domain-containing protein 5 isoform X1 [Protopterus annectens]
MNRTMESSESTLTKSSRNTALNEEQIPALKPKTAFSIFWRSMILMLFCVILGITILGITEFKQNKVKSVLQVVRITFQDTQGVALNQSAFVEKGKDAVTIYVTSQTNHTTAVLFDGRNGLVCYKSAEQDSCFIRKMEQRDVENVQTIVNMSENRVDQLLIERNKTKYYHEFLGILGRNPVDPNTVGERIQRLCHQNPIFWVRKRDGPSKQRLIYFCIDICFPNNICVSVCFYYLPD